MAGAHGYLGAHELGPHDEDMLFGPNGLVPHPHDHDDDEDEDDDEDVDVDAMHDEQDDEDGMWEEDDAVLPLDKPVFRILPFIVELLSTIMRSRAAECDTLNPTTCVSPCNVDLAYVDGVG